MVLGKIFGYFLKQPVVRMVLIVLSVSYFVKQNLSNSLNKDKIAPSQEFFTKEETQEQEEYKKN